MKRSYPYFPNLLLTMFIVVCLRKKKERRSIHTRWYPSNRNGMTTKPKNFGSTPIFVLERSIYSVCSKFKVEISNKQGIQNPLVNSELET